MSTEVDLKQEDRALVFRLGFSGSNLNVTTFLTLKFAPLSETKKEKFKLQKLNFSQAQLRLNLRRSYPTKKSELTPGIKFFKIFFKKVLTKLHDVHIMIL